MTMPANKSRKTSSSRAGIPPELLLRKVNEAANPLSILVDKENDNKDVSILKEVSGLLLDIRCYRWNDIPVEKQNWALSLTETNMKTYYEGSKWGWSLQSKQSEFRNIKARFLLIYTVDDETISSNPIAFVHFRFEEGYASDPVLYCYELQVEEAYRRRGVGKYLMELLADLGKAHRMKKLLLTVLKANTDAWDFYTKALGFKVDRASPGRCGEAAEYDILNQMLN